MRDGCLYARARDYAGIGGVRTILSEHQSKALDKAILSSFAAPLIVRKEKNNLCIFCKTFQFLLALDQCVSQPCHHILREPWLVVPFRFLVINSCHWLNWSDCVQETAASTYPVFDGVGSFQFWHQPLNSCLPSVNVHLNVQCYAINVWSTARVPFTKPLT